MSVRNLLVLFFVVILAHVARGAEPNRWSKLDKATIEGPRFDVPIGYSPVSYTHLTLPTIYSV